jgi:O-antigen ligase
LTFAPTRQPPTGPTLRPDGGVVHLGAVAPQDRLALRAACLGVCVLPVLTPRGPANLAPADMAFLLAIGASLLWAASTRAQLSLPYRAGVGAMVVAGLVSGLLGRWPGPALLTVSQDLFLLAWAATLATVMRDAPAVGAVLRTWVWSSALWAVAFVAATSRTALASGSDAERVSFVFGDQNAAGLYLVLSLLVMVAAGWPRSRVARLAIGLVLLTATFYTGSLGALSGLLLGLSGGLVYSVRGRRGLVPAVAVAAALVLATASVAVLVQRSDLIALAHESSNSLLRNSIGREAQSSSERAVLRGESFDLWRASDAIGSGPATTKNLLSATQAPYPKEAHNDWLATLIERGVLGTIGLLLLVGELALRGQRAWARAHLDDALSRAVARPGYLVGALMCLLAFSLTHEVLHDRSAWTLFGAVAAVAFGWHHEPRWRGETRT